ncbi:MAG: NADH-quinone oxidoreductase subunit H, partial [Planctomycetia bacterium]|nr:NADH-quinone oxidoreductase subunit H [Planctomycetia bacterium]
MIHFVPHVLMVIAFPPLLQGMINRTKAFFGGRQGPPLFQAYYDLWRLLHKGSVVSTTTTCLFRFGPVASLVTTVFAAMLIPMGQPVTPISFTGDLLLFAYVLALGRFFLVLSALDTGSSFEGMGAAREVSFACLAEPTMFFCLLILAKVSGSLRMVELFGGSLSAESGGAGVLVLLVIASWFLLMLAENCRIPFDDPNTHLELTMIHEVIILDHSGPMLALLQLAAAIKQFVFAALVVRLAVPLNFSSAWANWLIFTAAVLGVAVLLGVVESAMARLRMTIVPHVLTAAGVIAGFGFVLLVVF